LGDTRRFYRGTVTKYAVVWCLLPIRCVKGASKTEKNIRSHTNIAGLLLHTLPAPSIMIARRACRALAPVRSQNEGKSNSMSRVSDCRVLAVVNQKGGVGKTTTAVNVGAYLAMANRKVLVIDCDPQSNATSGLGVDKGAVSAGLYDVLVESTPLGQIILKSVGGIKGLDLAPSTIDLSGAEMVLYSEQNFAREHVLRKAIEPERANYDFILIDAPPSLGLLTINVLTAADALLIPIQCEYYALEGISQLLAVISRIQERLNPRLEIAKVILTMQDYRTNLSSQVVADVRAYFGEKVAGAVIPRNVRLSEAPSFGQPISLYDPKSKGAGAYRDLAQEVMKYR